VNLHERFAAQMGRALESLPGDFERVVYLASLRDTYSGRYLHEGLATLGTAEEVHAELQARHRDAFTMAGRLPLDSLCRQLQEHFARLGSGTQETAAMWMELEPYRDIFPAGCSELEREFFLSQMRAALQLLAGSLKLGFPPEPIAWPHR